MPIALILQYALQYGLPAALEIVKLFQKQEVTLADWEAAFAVAQTPYGLTPQIIVPTPVLPPGTKIIVDIKLKPDGTREFCEANGDCTAIPPTVVLTPSPVNGKLFQDPTNQQWFLLP